MSRTLLRGTLAGIVLLSLGAPGEARACCEPEMRPVWVHGTYSNAAQGDVIANVITSTSMIAPIMAALGENYSHAMALFRTTGEVMENLADPSSIITGWDCSHPLDPEQTLDPMGPGAQIAVWADSNTPNSNYYVYQTAEVLHGAVHTTAYNIQVGNYCVVWPLGSSATPTVGYYLYGYSHTVTNGQCVQMLTDSCFVPKPAAKPYSASTVANAASAMYNAIYSMASNQMSWLDNVFCSGGARYAANQVVNTFLYNNPWDTNQESWQVPVTTVVTPGQLVATYPAALKEPAHLVPGYYTTQEVMVCHAGACY